MGIGDFYRDGEIVCMRLRGLLLHKHQILSEIGGFIFMKENEASDMTMEQV